MTQLTFLSEEHPANLSVLLDFGKALMMSVATCHLSLYAFVKDYSHAGWFGKMCLGSCQSTEEGLLPPSLRGWGNAGMGSPIGFLTLDILECHSAAGGCSLSQILEAGNVPRRYFLSAKTCNGLLKRVKVRKKRLSEHLQN